MKKYILSFLLVSLIVFGETEETIKAENSGANIIENTENNNGITEKKSDNFIVNFEKSSLKLEEILKNDSIDQFKQYLIQNDINFEEQGKEILELASYYDSINLFNYLVLEGIDIWDEDIQYTLVMNAIDNDSIKVFRYLEDTGFSLKSKIDVGDIETENVSLLYYAVNRNASQILLYLLNKKLDINEKYSNNKNLLMLAAKNNNIEVANILINNGLNIEEENDYKNNALMISAYYDSVDVLKLLLEKKANIEKKNIDGDTALMLAIKNNSMNALEILIKNGASLTEKNNEMISPLKESINRHNFEIIEKLLKNKVNFSKDELEDNKEIFDCIVENDLVLLKFLISIGMNLNNVNEDGKSPLSLSNSEEIKNLLIENGANKNEEMKYKINKMNYKIMEIAIENEDIEEIKKLASKVDLTKPNKFLDNAIRWNQVEIIDALLNNNCYVNYMIDNSDEGGEKIESILRVAIENKNIILVKKIVDGKYNPYGDDYSRDNLTSYNYYYDDQLDIASYLVEKNVVTEKDILNKECDVFLSYLVLDKLAKEKKDINSTLDILLSNGNLDGVLKYAYNNENKELVKIIINKELEKNWVGTSDLCKTVSLDMFDLSKKILDSGVKAEFEVTSSANIEQPLAYAVENGNKLMVELLIKYGASVDNFFKKAPIYVAAMKDYVEILKFMIPLSKKSINSTYRNPYVNGIDTDVPVIRRAVETDSINSVKYLLTLSPDMQKAFPKYSILLYATEFKAKKVFDYLVASKKYTIDSASNNGVTPLLLAVELDNIEMVNYLIKKGADIYRKDYFGKGVLEYAKSTEVRKIFIDKGLKDN